MKDRITAVELMKVPTKVGKVEKEIKIIEAWQHRLLISKVAEAVRLAGFGYNCEPNEAIGAFRRVLFISGSGNGARAIHLFALVVMDDSPILVEISGSPYDFWATLDPPKTQTLLYEPQQQLLVRWASA